MGQPLRICAHRVDTWVNPYIPSIRVDTCIGFRVDTRVNPYGCWVAAALNLPELSAINASASFMVIRVSFL